MSEIFNYDIVNQITNQDYISRSRGLFSRCQEIDNKYKSGQFRDCCKAVRSTSEGMLRYIFDRVVEHRNKEPMAGEILRNGDFCEKVNDSQLIYSAGEVQRIGNKYSHEERYSNETDTQYEIRIKQEEEILPMDTKVILEQFSIVLDKGVTYINNEIPGVRGYLEILFKQKTNVKNGDPENVLEADVKDVDDRRDYTYVWKIQGQDRIFRERTYIISLNQPWMEGKTIILEAVKKGTDLPPLMAQYGPIKKEEILSNRKSPAGKVSQTVGGQNGSAPNGKLIIVKAENYNGAGVRLDAKLNDADFKIGDDGVSVEWGFIGSNEKYIRITGEKGQKNMSFKCKLKDRPFGKKYTCTISREGFDHPLRESYRELTQKDFEIRGDVEIQFDPEERALRASVSNPNYNGQPDYTWYRNGEILEKENGRTLKISKDDMGAAFECEISHSDLIGSRKTEVPYIVKDDVFTRENFTDVDVSGKTISEAGDNKEGDEKERGTADPGPDGKIVIFPDKDNDWDKDNDNDKDNTGDDKAENGVESKDNSITSGNTTREYKIKLPYEMKRVNSEHEEFFTSAALVHYFVCPNDYFALNSLELVSQDIYLYRLLKVSRFEYVYFVEVEGTECIIYSYDEASRSAFPKDRNVQGEKKTLSGLSSFQKREKVNDQNEPSTVENTVGRRRVRHFSTGEEFRMQFATAIKNALDDREHKVAVVMPIRIFGKDGYCTDPVIDTLGNMVKNNETENVLLITLPGKSDFLECFNPEQRKIHDWINTVRGEAGTTNGEMLNYATDLLLKQGRLLIADTYQADEFANLLLRKKIIEKNQGLAQIDSAKIFALAESLRDYLINENTTERYTTLKTLKQFKGNALKELNRLLDKKEVCQELVEKANDLSAVRVGYTHRMIPLQIERVYHNYYDRYENDNSLEEVTRQFEKFAGEETQEIISQIRGVVGFLADERNRIDEQRQKGSFEEEMPYMNMVFFGNPGTGKTTIAKLTAKYMKAMGVLPTDRFAYITASTVIEGTVGNTAANIREAAQNAVGGILMIDEFQGLEQAYQGGNVAKNALEAIVGIINSHRDDLCIIIAGYKDGVENVLKHDQGADRRFPENNRFLFKDFSSDTLLEILHSIIERRGETIEDGADEILKTVIENKIQDESRNFGNAGYIEAELVPALEIAKSKRQKGSKKIMIDDIKEAFPNVERVKLSKEEILRKFDSLIGKEMQSVKNDIMEAAAVFKDTQKSIRAMKERGETPDENDMPYMNMIFAGGPGTGKTTVAKLTAKYLRAEGILPMDKYVYISATQNVEGTVGETGKKIREAARKAEGGVLFIDEFHGFDKGHSSGNMAQEAMNEIVSIVNEHREDLCIIFAGYKQGVDKVLRFDVGARRRYPNRIHFRDYSVDTLMMIMEDRLKRMSHGMEEDAKELVKTVIEHHKKEAAGSFGNGGYVKDELLLMLDRKRLKRPDNNGIYIKQDVIDAFPEIFGNDAKVQSWKPRKISREEMEGIQLQPLYDLRERDSEELQRVTDNAILYITTDHGQGTAFLIHPDGYALTCSHVIRDSKEITARVRIKGRAGGDDSTHKCTVINAREDLDIAIIKLDGSNFPYIPVARKEREIRKGEKFILSGYPFGKRTAEGMTTYQGTVATSGEHTDESQLVMYYINGEAKSGNSGSPVISMTDGQAIGILCGSLDERSTATKTEEINYMRPAYYFWEEFVK